MKKYFWILAVALTAGLVHADAGDVKARQQYMKEWRGLNKQMGNIIKSSDAQSFPAQDFAALAARLNDTASQPWPHFKANSQDSDSEATAAVWSKPQEFQAAIQKFNQSTAALDQAAKNGQYDAVKTAYHQMTQNCKSCHQAFKD